MDYSSDEERFERTFRYDTTISGNDYNFVNDDNEAFDDTPLMTNPNRNLNPNSMPSTSVNRMPSTSVNRVSIKPPVFYRSNPSVWFRQMESQFVLANITQSTTKFHHILAALPEDVAINLPSAVTTYAKLKEQICSIYTKSRQELIEEALGNVSLDGQKPSICLLKIQRKLAECNLMVDDDIVRHRLMQAMPISTRTALSAHTTLAPTEFAKLADTIYSYAKSEQVNSVQSSPSTNNNFASGTSSYGRGTYNRGGFRGGHISRGGNQSTTDSHRPFSEGQRPKICRFHLFYAEKARTCKPWCKWPGTKPAAIDPSSRAASPVPREN